MNPVVKKLAVMTGAFIVLSSAGSLAWASDVTIPNTFTSGTPALAAQVNGNFAAVKTAVDDNDARIDGLIANTQAGALKTAVDANTTNTATNTAAISSITSTNTTQTTDIDNLKGNWVGSVAASCRDNTGAVDANAVRVGSVCIDKYRARVTIGSCVAAGTTGCDTVTAQSTSTGSATASLSWAQAVRACANVGKRLPSTDELAAAYLSGAITDLANDTADYVGNLGETLTGAPMSVGYLGVNLSGLGSPGAGILQGNNNAAYSTGYVYIYFRCAR